MFKKILALTVPMALSLQANASAFDSLETQEMQNKAVVLLREKANAGEITMRGDVHSYEKLSDILKALDVYENELLEALSTGADIEALNGPVKSVETKCAVRSQTLATCGIMITYRPLGETYIEFSAILDANKTVVDVGSVAEISRGD
ncbi:metalloproteinase domain-containing protein [Bdellovibrio bacteriovorus W]|nr:metalloproteinase domain-containing protein [Bdellovibrio bacteriovorus W]